jgi:integrase
VDVVKIKELTGHASITTTMRYMHASDEGKRAAVNKLPAYRLGTAWNCHPIVTKEKRQVA